MKHRNSARELARQRGPVPRILSVLLFVNLLFVTHSGVTATVDGSHFTDPTAIVQCDESYNPCHFGSNVYIGPFAILMAGNNPGKKKTPGITIGNNSNVQDNTILDATRGPITLGDSVIIAHGAAIYGGASIGVTGNCRPTVVIVCASFVGFNSEVAESAVVQRDAMVTHLAKVDAGMTIPSGRVVPPGVEIKSEEDVRNKTVKITQADREFMANVIHVNVALAAGYIDLESKHSSAVCGINRNPETSFAPSQLPTFAGVDKEDPRFPNRIIGRVAFSQSNVPEMGNNVALRADEGTPFAVGTIGLLRSYTTFHALEGTQLRLGPGGEYGVGSLVHGGKDHNKITRTGSRFKLGAEAVYYNSTAEDNCTIGEMSFVADSNLPAGFTVRPRTVYMAGKESPVEWIRRPRPTVKNNRERCPR
jgi:carbonic anhydrase/acetyltransferase-like protein (isoleucine patch superfamily)